MRDLGGATFPIKARELEAAVLFADISSFTATTAALDPVSTLAFVNTYIAWITTEALADTKGVIDKYIGDEVMVVFSPDMGSEDAVGEALHVAQRMIETDLLDFRPHVGIASGQCAIGVVGTPVRYQCSVFGAPVALAARCSKESVGAAITLPTDDWSEREVAKLVDDEHAWSIEERNVEPKGLGQVSVTQLRFEVDRPLNFSLAESVAAQVSEIRGDATP